METKLTRIGIICPSEIALRRFLPSLTKLPNFRFVGVAIADLDEWKHSNIEIINKEQEKANTFIHNMAEKDLIAMQV